MNIDQFVHKPHPFFGSMCQAHLQILARAAMYTHFNAGDLIFREGDRATHFYLLENGKVSIQTHSAGKPVELQTLGAGDALGWSWLFAPSCWHFDARAEENTEAVSFSAETLRKACEADKVFGYELLKRVTEVMADRLHATRRKLVQSVHPDRSEGRAVGVS